MRIKIILFLFCFIVNVFCMERYSNGFTSTKLTVACPNNCGCVLVGENNEKLALLILTHIFRQHSSGVNDEFKDYTKKHAKLTNQKYFSLKCYCGIYFTAFNTDTLANNFKEHRLINNVHNKQGFRNMLEYVYDNAQKI